MFSQKYFQVRLLNVVFILTTHLPVIGQEYYTSSTGRANIHFVVSGELRSASTDQLEIIYNKKKETVWITFSVQSFVAENKKLTKKLFKKNKTEFVIKGNLAEKNAQSVGIDYLQFVFIGRIFNDNVGGYVRAAGRIDFSLANKGEEYKFTLSTGIKPKWFGAQFDEMVEYPTVNIHIITTVLKSINKQSRNLQ